MKKRWFGAGKRNGAGGKVKDSETIIQWALRELHEETWALISEDALRYKGVLHFVFEGEEEKNQDCSVFFGVYEWEVYETEEMLPKWFDIEAIPFSEMWEDDPIWLPRLLNGEQDIEYRFIFTGEEMKLSKVIQIS